MTIARVLPNSLEAEQAVLACILLDEEVPLTAFTNLRAEDFYSNAHKTIFEAMQEVYASSKPVDFVTVVDKLESLGKLDEVGGLTYITNLTSMLAGGGNYKYYEGIIKNHARRREIISASQNIIDNAFEKDDGKEVLNFAEHEIFEISQKEEISALEHVSKALPEVMANLEKLAQDSDKIRGIATGLNSLDNITNGLQRSDLILLAARPGVGKTTLAMNIINHAATTLGKKCAVFSLEMPKSQLMQRALCSIGKVDMGKLLKGKLNETEWQKLWRASKTLTESGLYIDDNSMNTAMDILSKCRRRKRESGLDLVMIDYLQLMESEKSLGSRTLEIGEITRKLKIAAKELDVPIILLSQLSRDVEKRDDHHPQLADLRDSGSIEQDADIVMFLYNPDKYHDNAKSAGDEQGVVELDIAKHRNGEVGTIKLKWVGSWLRFFDYDNPEVQQERKMRSQDDVNEISEVVTSEDIDQLFSDVPPPEEEY